MCRMSFSIQFLWIGFCHAFKLVANLAFSGGKQHWFTSVSVFWPPPLYKIHVLSYEQTAVHTPTYMCVNVYRIECFLYVYNGKSWIVLRKMCAIAMERRTQEIVVGAQKGRTMPTNQPFAPKANPAGNCSPGAYHYLIADTRALLYELKQPYAWVPRIHWKTQLCSTRRSGFLGILSREGVMHVSIISPRRRGRV